MNRSRGSSLRQYNSIPVSAEDLKLEEETLEKEFQWLIQTQLDATLKDIDKYLNECAKSFSLVLNPSSVTNVHKILLQHHQQGEPTVCVAAVHGDKISTADITLRLQGKLGSSRPLRTSIKEHAAWKLRQIQDSANQFILAQKHLAVLMENKHKLSTPTLLRQAFLELSNCLNEAEQVLVVPILPAVGEIYSAELRSHFKPELPEDIVIHFHINSQHLVLTIVTVAPVSKPPSIKKSSSFHVGTVFEHGNSYYEVTTQLQLQAVIPWLLDVIRCLRETKDLIQDFRNKIEIF